MAISTTAAAATMALTFGGVALLHAEPAAAPVRVAVRIQNVAGVSASTLKRAEVDARRIYATAGVDLGWLTAPGTGGAPDLQLTIILTPVAPRESRSGSDALGMALAGNTGCGRVAYVMWKRVEDFARAEHRTADVLLGSIIAHELGHLLLAYNAHTRTGIMQSKWTAADFDDAHRGLVRFTSGQATRLLRQIENEYRLIASGQVAAGPS